MIPMHVATQGYHVVLRWHSVDPNASCRLHHFRHTLPRGLAEQGAIESTMLCS